MTGNKCYLTEYEYYDGGFVSFGDGKGRISGKGKIKSGTLVFDDVYFCKELKNNLFSVSQIYDKKNNVLFTDTECLVLSSDFKLLDESQVLLRVPRKDNIYSVNLKSVVPTKDVVFEGWDLNASGFFMFKVVKKLKNLKKPFRKLLYTHGNIHENVMKLRTEVDRVQKDLDSDPFNLSLREKEAECVNSFNEALIVQECFLKQKAKIQWLKEGDSNSAYFHKAVKSRISRSRIDIITNSVGTIFENERVADAFVDHYEVFLGQDGITQDLDTNELIEH
ncbi:hypothetical protein Tco_1411125 [Tanacetum coccineum]